MIYLDYSATTPVNKEVLDTFNKASIDFIGNANSLHQLGINCHNLINSSTDQIKNILNINDYDVIYTSGSTEANNLAIKSICTKYSNRGRKIITTKFEHSSVKETLSYLEQNGYKISYLKNDKNGLVDLDNLKELLTDDTILVCINAVNSELGLLEPVEEIGNILKNYPKCFYHVDLTQALGKVKINLENIDLASFSAHKIYGIKGIGCLIKKKSIEIEPLIHGGKSTTRYRSGTPAHPLIASFSKSIRIAYSNIDTNYEYVKGINNYLRNKLKKLPYITINSNDYCIPYILNISVKGILSETLMRALSLKEIYVSTKSACNDNNSLSENVLTLTNNEELARTSIRISLSYLTTKEEIDNFVNILNSIYTELIKE